MKLGGTPNDLLQNLQTIFMLAFIPILDGKQRVQLLLPTFKIADVVLLVLIYPAFRKANITFPPILRIAVGFFCASLSMTYACVLQHYIYSRPPFSIPVWTQAPAYIFGALPEIWVVVTGLEVAFIKAPDNLKAFVSSMFWLTIAIGSAIGIGLAPVSADPYMVWTYGALALQVFVAGVLFWLWFRKDVVRDIRAEGEMQVDDVHKLRSDEEKV